MHVVWRHQQNGKAVSAPIPPSPQRGPPGPHWPSGPNLEKERWGGRAGALYIRTAGFRPPAARHANDWITEGGGDRLWLYGTRCRCPQGAAQAGREKKWPHQPHPLPGIDISRILDKPIPGVTRAVMVHSRPPLPPYPFPTAPPTRNGVIWGCLHASVVHRTDTPGGSPKSLAMSHPGAG